MKHKIIKIIFINIFLLVFFFCFIEFLCLVKTYNYNVHYKNEESRLFKGQTLSRKEKLNSIIFLLKRYKKNTVYYKKEFRKPIGLEYKNEPVILLGCSYNFGYYLKEKETFHYILAHYTKHPVYNLAIVGGSLRDSLYILRNNDLRTKLTNNTPFAKYFIYTYIPSHQKRLFSNFRIISPNFKPTNNYSELKYFDDFFNNRTYIGYWYNFFAVDHIINKEEKFKLMKLYFKEINKEIKKYFKDGDKPSKLVIFVYSDNSNFPFEELEKDGIIIIRANKLLNINITNKEYMLPDGNHPNAKAWEVIVPVLAKELNL